MADSILQGTMVSESQTPQKQQKKVFDPKRRRAMLDMLAAGEDPGFVKYNHVMHGFDQEEADDAINTYYQVTGQQNPIQQQTKPAQADLSGASALERQSIADTDATINMANEALELLYPKEQKGKPTVGTGVISGNIGKAKQMLPGGGDERFNQLDMKLANIKANFMKALSGAAVSEQEVKRLSQFLPSTTDQEEVIKLKLESLKGELAHRKEATYRSLGIDPGAEVEKPQQPSLNDQASQWLQANPDDPRAGQVREKINSGYYNKFEQVQSKEEQQTSSPLVDPDTDEVKTSGFFSELGEQIPKLAGDIASRAGNIFNEINTARKDKTLLGGLKFYTETPLRVAGQVAGMVGDTFSAAFNVGIAALPEGVKETASKTMESILSTDAGKAGIEALKQGTEAYKTWKENNPNLAKDVEAITNIAFAATAFKGTKPLMKEAGATIGDVSKVATILGKNPVEKANNVIFKAVKPSITGGKKLKDVRSAMEASTSEIVARGHSPKNFQEYVEAISSTKNEVWDDIAQKIGASDARVNIRSIADDVVAMADDPTLARVDQAASSRLKSMAEALVSKGDDISIKEAESIKQYLNAELQGTFGKFNLSASETNAKKLITSRIGQQLDEVLSSVPGEFSGLKKAYGSLRQAEEDALKRAVVFARQNPAGLIDSFSKISGVGNIIKGVATMNPGDIARGAGELALGKIQKMSNNADDMIRKAFGSIEKSKEGFKSKLFNIRPGMSIQDVSGGKAGYNFTEQEFHIPNVSKKNISRGALNEMNDFTSFAVRETGKVPERNAILTEIRARKIAEKLGLNPDVSNKELAIKFGKILERKDYREISGIPKKGNGEIRSTILSKKDPLLQEARKYKSAEINRWRKDRFWGTTITDKSSEINVPISQIGEGKTIGIRQPEVTEKGVLEWMTKIKNGERPAILVGNRPMGQREITVLDGNHTLEAYRRLGFKEIPVIDQKSQLIDIWKKAHKK